MIPSVHAGTIQGAASIASGPDPRLKPAAHEFEACLMKEFLEPLQKDALFSEAGDDTGGEGSGNALMSFGSEALARAISQRGGFGIATRIIDHFEHGAHSGDQHGNTENRQSTRQRLDSRSDERCR